MLTVRSARERGMLERWRRWYMPGAHGPSSGHADAGISALPARTLDWAACRGELDRVDEHGPLHG